MKRVRMLLDKFVDGRQYLCNQVVDFPDGLGADLVKDGAADEAKPAVDYCLTELKAVPVAHPGAEEKHEEPRKGKK